MAAEFCMHRDTSVRPALRLGLAALGHVHVHGVSVLKIVRTTFSRVALIFLTIALFLLSMNDANFLLNMMILNKKFIFIIEEQGNYTFSD